MKSVSIIIVSQWKRHIFINNLFDIIKSQTYQNIVEIIIVNGTPIKEEHDMFESFLMTKIEQELTYNIKYISTSMVPFEDKKIGRFRNIANDNALLGDIIVCMDDDDYYQPTYIETCVNGLINNPSFQIVGCSALYMYDYDMDTIFKLRNFSEFHTTNSCMAYTKEFKNTHRYVDSMPNAEEQSFLNNFQIPIYQMDPLQTILQMSYGANTYNKRKCINDSIYATNIGAKLQTGESAALMEMTSLKLRTFIKNKGIYNSFCNIFKAFDSTESVDICYYCGFNSIEWSPLDKSLGGSEKAIVELSTQWVLQGKTVHVYAPFKEDEIIYNGVVYKNVSHFKYRTSYKSIILWRFSGIFPMIYTVNKLSIKNIYVDVHDNCILEESHKVYTIYLNLIAGFFFKSHFHKQQFTDKLTSLNITYNKSIMHDIPNGLQLDYFNSSLYTNLQRNKYRFCYTSCYTRGLEYLLSITWPILYKLEPRCEFHIYYGTEWIQSPERLFKLKQLLCTEGVMDHGRRDIDIISYEKHLSTFHLYFTSCLGEIDCLAIRESVACGCIPIISNESVFSERAGIHIPLNASESASYTQLAYEIHNLLQQSDEEINNIRDTLQYSTNAHLYDWSYVADKWLEIID